MTDSPIRKVVKPAHPGARIPDLAHRNDLPQDGASVIWDSYWMGREMRGEIIVVDEPTNDTIPAEATADPETPPAETPPT